MRDHKERIRIGLLWHSIRSGNLGVGALTVANLGLAREAAALAGRVPHFTVIGMRDGGPAYVAADDVEEYPLDGRRLFSPRAYWRRLASLDYVLDIGGGDSFTDIYGEKRFAFLWLSKLLAACRGVPLLLSPQTIGPFRRSRSRWLAAHVLRRAKAVVVRDPLSLDAARALVPGGRLVQSVDVAFALPYVQAPRRTNGRIAMGVNVSGLLFNQGARHGLEVDYPALMRALLAQLSARDDVAVSLVCHVCAPDLPHDDDGAVADMLAAEFPEVERVPDFASPSDAKSFISGLDFLVAGRMHACIAAYSSGVPVMPVAYSRKFSGLFEGLLNYRHMVPVKGLSTAAALAMILDSIERRGALAQEIGIGNARVAEHLGRYRAELVRLFRKC